MSSYQSPVSCLSFEQALAPFLTSEGLPFADVLSAKDVAQAFDDEGVSFGATAKSVFTPTLTLWAFLSQVLEEAKSCRAAVLRVMALLVALGRRPCAEDTSAYCRARAKIPAVVIRRLTQTVGRNLERDAPAHWLWHGRHVTLVDGTTVTLPDTPENQKAYPQSTSQEPGLGFPIVRMVVLLSLATGALLDMAMGPYQGKETGETALLRELLDSLDSGDVLLADRYYCNYWMVALAQACGVDVVFRMHQCRDYDFSKGQRLGEDDHLVVWNKPKCPDWMDAETYAEAPETLQVREVRVEVATAGFRTKELVIVTTLTDPTDVSAEEIADLYHERWHAELDIRAIKQSLRMEHLRCQSPFMVEKEIWAHFLGYNLVRKVSAQAALKKGLAPRQISFSATQQALNALRSQLTLAGRTEQLRQALQVLATLGKVQVGKRPDRYEPRAVKRRPKQYARLTKPRAQARQEILQGHER